MERRVFPARPCLGFKNYGQGKKAVSNDGFLFAGISER
jgi:hypothetical protein